MADYSYDSQAEWEGGDFSGCHAVSPAGKLTPGVAPETIAELVAESDLSVYLRCSEGSGATLANLGSAGDGTLADGSWDARDDGRAFITGGTVTVGYHSSMKVMEDNNVGGDGSSYDWVAQIRVKFASISAAVFMQRSNRFQLGMDASGYPYIKNYYHISRVYDIAISYDTDDADEWIYLPHTNIESGTLEITDEDGNEITPATVDYTNGKFKFSFAGEGTVLVDYVHHKATGWSELADDTALTIGEWHTIGAVCAGGSLYLYVDGEAVARLTSSYADNDPGTDLTAGFYGDWTDVMYAGGSDTKNLVSFPASGSWSKEINIGSDKTLRYLEIDASIDQVEHGVTAVIAFADDADDLDYVETWSWSSLVDGFNRLYPPEGGLIHGTQMKITLSIREGDYDRDAVLIDSLDVYLRTPATPLIDQSRIPYGSMMEEVSTREDLVGLIQEVRVNRMVLRNLSRSVYNLERKTGASAYAPGAPMPSDYTTGTYTGTEDDWTVLQYEMNGIKITLTNLQQQVTPLAELAYYRAELANTRISTVTGWLWEGALDTYVRNILSTGGYATESYADSAVSTHAALTTGTHGAGSDTLATDADIASAISVHAGLKAETHGLSASQYFTYTETGTVREAAQASDLSTHASATTGVHGVGGNYVAPTGNPATTVEAKILTHSNLKTTVHGATVYDLADEGDITSAINTHNNDTTSVHGIAYTGDLATVSYADGAISSHAALQTGVHGVGSDYVAFSGYHQATEWYISGHEGRCVNYST